MARIVLIADDSPTIQKRAVGILKGDGYEVDTVSNGVAAIKRLSTVRPTVILADVCMPGRDGYEVCDHVKKTPGLSHIPVVLLTSDMEPYDGAKGTAVRANGILKKPFEGRELIALVEKLSEESEAAAVPVDEVPIAPSADAASPVQEFEVAREEEPTPTLISSPAPDFSAHSGGMAFAETAEENAPAFPAAHGIDLANFALDPQPDQSPTLHANDFEFPGLHRDEPAPAENTPPAEPSTFLAGFGAPAEHPVFSEEPAAAIHASGENPALRTAIFGEPIELAAPALKEAARAAEAGAAAGLEPQFISEGLDVSALGDHGHSHPHPHDHADDHGHPHDEDLHEHSHAIDPLNATNLGNFSLDAAAAGHVRFNADVPEVIYADESAEAAALAEPAVETASPKSAIPEVVYADASTEEAALKVSAPEAAAAESAGDEPLAQAAEPSAPAAELVYAEASSSEGLEDPSKEPLENQSREPQAALTDPEEAAAIGEVALESHEASAGEPQAAESKVDAAGSSTDHEPEAALPEREPADDQLLEAAAEKSEDFPLEAAKEEFHDVAAAVGAAAETSVTAEAPSEPAIAEASRPEPVAETSPAVLASAPKSTLDHEFVYSIVHKVVAHMAPSFLGDEAKADLAKRIASQIAGEMEAEKSKKM